MMRNILFLFFSFYLTTICAQDLKKPVVLVNSGNELGSGFLVGYDSDFLYIFMALHTIDPESGVTVTFYDHGAKKYKADPYKSNAIYDAAVVRCRKPREFSLPRSFSPFPGKTPLKERVIVVGHPNGKYWDINNVNEIKSAKENASYDFFSIYSTGLSNGNSGGPVLNQNNRLLGMVLEEDKVKITCLAKDQIINLLTDWDIPQNLIQPLPNNYADPQVGQMILVKGGSFTMGQSNKNLGGSRASDDEQPAHQVDVPTFYLGKHEVSQGQWKAIMGNNPSQYQSGDNYPVENVSWDEVKVFIERLNQRSEHTYRLPTEAEWEYAAGGGNRSRMTYSGTNSEGELHYYGNYSIRDSYAKTSPVGAFKGNQFGFKDMSGNVWEWCEDKYHESYYQAPENGSARTSSSDSRRVLRGGCWRSSASSLRIHYRHEDGPGSKNGLIGFRLARTP